MPMSTIMKRCMLTLAHALVLSLPCHGVVWSNDKCRHIPSLQWIADMHPWTWRTTGPSQGAMKLSAMQYHGQGTLKAGEQRQALERARSQRSPEADQRLKPDGSSSLSNPSSRGEGTTSPVTPMKPMMSWPTRTTICTPVPNEHESLVEYWAPTAKKNKLQCKVHSQL